MTLPIPLAAAMEAAEAQGCRLRPIVERPGVAYLVCKACGYGDQPGLEVEIAKYADLRGAERFGCLRCAGEQTNAA